VGKYSTINAIYVQFTGHIQLKQGIKLFGWVYIGVMGKCRKKEDQTYLKLICILL